MVIFVKSECFERKGRTSCNAGNRELKISAKCQKNILCVTNGAACQVLELYIFLTTKIFYASFSFDQMGLQMPFSFLTSCICVGRQLC